MNFFDEFRSGRWIPNTIAICAGILFYWILNRISVVGVALGSIWKLITPLLIGVALAYIIDPLAVFFEKKGLARKPAVIATLVILAAGAVLLIVAMVPQLVAGVLQFADNFGDYMRALQKQLASMEHLSGGSDNSIAGSISKILDSISDYLTKNSLASTGSGIGGGVTTFIIGFIFAVYFLMGKQQLLTWLRQFLRKVLKDERYDSFAAFCARCHRILLSYITCSLLEAVIVGLVNLLFMLATGMPYASVISCIIGITNLAPTFGPIVGCIIGMFILLLAKPKAVILFLIFTLVLQTIDGYILKPKLFGDTLGVSPLLILIVLVMGGRLFGVWGLLLAIPFAAIVQYICQEILFPYTTARKTQESEREQTHLFDTFRGAAERYSEKRKKKVKAKDPEDS